MAKFKLAKILFLTVKSNILNLLNTDKNIHIDLSGEALDYLVDKGFNPKMGARPLQRVIDNDIKRPLSRLMLFGDLKNGGNITIKYTDKIELETNAHICEEI